MDRADPRADLEGFAQIGEGSTGVVVSAYQVRYEGTVVVSTVTSSVLLDTVCLLAQRVSGTAVVERVRISQIHGRS